MTPETRPLYLSDLYRKTATATVTAQTTDRGLIVDTLLFYPTGGGQPGDHGMLNWDGVAVEIETTVKSADGPVLVPRAEVTLPPVGAQVLQILDWDLR